MGKSVGSCTIYAYCGSLSASCSISVNKKVDPIISSGTIALTGSSSGLTTAKGNGTIIENSCSFNYVNAYRYNSNVIFISTNGCLYNTTNLGKITKVTIFYNKGGSNGSVQHLSFSSSEISGVKTSPISGTTFISSEGGTSQSYSPTMDYGFFNISISSKNLQATSIEIEYASNSEGANEKVLKDISATYVGEKIYVGDTLDKSKIKVTANFTDSNNYPSELVNDFEVIGFSSTSEGTNNLVISYTYNGVTKTCLLALTIYSNDDGKSTSGTTSFNVINQNFSDEELVSGPYTFDDNKNVSVTFLKKDGSNAPIYLENGNAICLYAGNEFVVNSLKANIKNIVLTFKEDDEGTNEITVNEGTFINNMWTCDGSNYASNVAFTIDGTIGNREISSIKVNYYSVNEFANDFLDNIVCDGGKTAPDVANWNNVKTNCYDILFSDDRDSLLKGSAGENGIKIEQALARYDYIIKKYNVDKEVYSDYISRFKKTNMAKYATFAYTNNIVIIVISSMSLIGIGFILIKERSLSKKHKSKND